MSKIFIMCSLLVLSVFSSIAEARDMRPGGPGRPGEQWPPQRPGQQWPGPGPQRPPMPPQRPPYPAPRPPAQQVSFQQVETFRVQKIIETTNVTRVNLPNVKAIRLDAQQNDVEIVEARVQLDDGREVYMDGITGRLGRDRSITYTFDGYYGIRIRSITLRAVTSGLTGSRADIVVSVGVLQ